jgi:hypothetical protein
VESNSQWQMRWDDNGSRFDVSLHGTITFTDDLTDVQSLSDGGSFTLRDWTGSIVPHTVKITAAGGKMTREYFVGGLSRGWDDEGRRFLAGHLPVLVRRSGLGAESRVKAIFGAKGADGVLDEVDRLLSDYARRLYLVALIDIAHPDSAGMLPILQRAGSRMTSDYDKRRVLEHVASKTALDKRGSFAYVQTMATMKSDYDQRLALNALTASGAGLDGDAAFQAIAHMKSNYDKRLVLAEIIGRGDISTATRKGVIDAARSMQSDYDRRMVLQAYIEKFGVELAVRDAFFAAVDAMRSDYDRAETLLIALKKQSVDAATRAAYVSSAERLRSRYDQDRVLAAVARAEQR